VKNRERGEFRDGGDDEVGERWRAMLAPVGE
jgi:hypothetical protein